MAQKRRVKAVIQFRRGIEPDWIKVDPVLREGEPAYSLDVGRLKIGTGKLKWSELPYISGGGGGIINYNSIINHPRIEGHELVGNKTFQELGLDNITPQEIDEIMFGG